MTEQRPLGELVPRTATSPVALTFVGTATTVLRLGGFTILTDPNFLHRGQRAYLGKGMWSKRRTDPALAPHQLPELDAVVLSHLHGDHWDRVARRNLDKTLRVLTTEQAARHLEKQGFGNATGMHTWQTERLESDTATLRITSMPGRHARGLMRHALPPVMGTMYELERHGHPPFRMYVSGDTLYVDELRRIHELYPDIDVAVLHLGGTKLLGMLVTMDAQEGSDLLELLSPRRAVPVHYDDYPVFKSGLDEFTAEVERRGLSDRVTLVNRGDSVELLAATD